MSKKKKKFKKFKIKAKISQQLQELERESKPQTNQIVAKTDAKNAPKATFQKEIPRAVSSSTITQFTLLDLKKMALVNAIIFGLLATIAIVNLKTDLVLRASQLIFKLFQIQ